MSWDWYKFIQKILILENNKAQVAANYVVTDDVCSNFDQQI